MTKRHARFATATVLSLVAWIPATAQELPVPQPPPLVARDASPQAAQVEPELPFAPPAAPFEAQLAALVNQQRALCPTTYCSDGPRKPLKHLPLLTSIADSYSETLATHDFFSHFDFSNLCLGPTQRAAAGGYTAGVSENAAAGNDTPSETIAQWMGSGGHRANILNSGVREMGNGYFYQPTDQGNIEVDNLVMNCICDAGEDCNGGPYYHYWVQMFGTRTTVYPLVIEGEAWQTSSGNVDLYLYAPGTGVQMRFSNDGVTWSTWEAYDAASTWSLAAGDGLRTVFAQVRNTAGTVVSTGCDRIWRTGGGGTELYVDGFECDGLAGWSDVLR